MPIGKLETEREYFRRLRDRTTRSKARQRHIEELLARLNKKNPAPITGTGRRTPLN